MLANDIVVRLASVENYENTEWNLDQYEEGMDYWSKPFANLFSAVNRMVFSIGLNYLSEFSRPITHRQ